MINPLATKIIQAEDSRRLRGTKALGIKVSMYLSVCPWWDYMQILVA